MKKVFLRFIILAAVVFSLLPAAYVYAGTATRLNSDVNTRGWLVSVSSYNIEGKTCFGIRDIAAIIKEQPYRFDLEWNEDEFKAYVIPGVEYKGTPAAVDSTKGETVEYTEKPLKISIYGSEYEIPAYNIGGRFYVPIRDLGEILGFETTWNESEHKITIGQGGSSDITIVTGKFGERPNKILALTFDDGPAAGSTEIILDALDKVGGHATFFMVGEMAEEYPQLVKKVFEQGSQIGNHSYSHSQLTKLSDKGIKNEVIKTQDIIFDICGVRPHIGRPPYGSLSDRVKDAVDLEWFNWNVDTLDWKYRDPDYVYNYVINNAKDGDTILMHDLHKTTAEAMARAIPKLYEMGFTLVTIDEMADFQGGYDKVKGHL